MNRKCMFRLATSTFAAAVLLLLSVGRVEAIPAFARKYRTSCQTCHIVYPNLTPFGEAFRLNGFRFPEGTDEDFRKDEPMRLGAEAYKKMWPNAVWPADFPSTVPFAMVLATEAKYEPDSAVRSQIAEVEGELLAGGTVGENVSFYGEIEFGLDLETDEAELGVERAYASFKPWVMPYFAFKIGLFEPGIALVSNHRKLTGARYWLMMPPAGLAGGGGVVFDNAFQLEAPAQAGIELWGIASHRFLWNLGYVEGKFNEPNNSKDVYARIAGKWGGMRLDGTVKEGEFSPEKPQPWRETSFTASAFLYSGKATVTGLIAPGPPPVTSTQDDDFTILGADIKANLRDLIVHAGFSRGNNDNPDVTGAATDVDSETAFIELDWVARPWLVPALRYETFELTGTGLADDKKVRWVPTINCLIRANVKGFLAAEVERSRGGDFNTEEIEAGLVIGF